MEYHSASEGRHLAYLTSIVDHFWDYNGYYKITQNFHIPGR